MNSDYNKIVEPTVIHDDKFDTDRYRHPAYATLSFARRNGGKTELFGSSIEHDNIISMTLYHADMQRNLNSDWYMGRNIIAEVEMSQSQFAEAITSMNMGSGVPVTLRFTEKDGYIPKCSFDNKRKQFSKEFNDKLKKANTDTNDLIKTVTELFNKKSLTKEDKKLVLSALNKISSNIGCNASFIADQFEEQMDKTIMEAKGEVEAFVQNRISSIAAHAMANKQIDMSDMSPVALIDDKNE